MHLNTLILATLFVPVISAATLTVGSGKQFTRPCAAIAAAAPGDLIEIDAGTYSGDVCGWSKNGLTLRGVGGRARIDAAGQQALDKGIWVIDGTDTVVENIEFTGAAVPAHNGAGIRLGPGGNLTVRNCYFHHNENGILTSNYGGTILIEFSEFAYNGYGDAQSHNLYVGLVNSFTMRYSYSHHSIQGQLVKSRAAVNYVLYNQLSDEPGGSGSYELSFPNGGLSYVIGNLIQQSPESPNYKLLEYMSEGPQANNPNLQLYVVNNTFVNDGTESGIFVSASASATTPIHIQNNIFVGPGVITNQPSAILLSNLFGSDPRFVNRAGFDYRLNSGSPAIDAGTLPGTGFGFSLAPQFQYLRPVCGQDRRSVGVIDIGAFEFGNTPQTTFCGSTSPAPNPVSISISPTSVTLSANQTQQFSAAVSGSTNTSVTWSMNPAAGTLSASGLYTAPASISSQQAVTVTATSLADPAKSAQAVVTLKPTISVSVSPLSVSLQANQTQQFSANVSATWSLNPAIGSLSASGLYTAPASISSQQAVTVTATSVADPTKTAQAVVTLNPPVSVSVIVSPSYVSLQGKQGQQFSAIVSGASNTAVTWSVSPAVGTISATGFYRAPKNIWSAQTVTVRATSNQDPTKSASATVNLIPKNSNRTTASAWK